MKQRNLVVIFFTMLMAFGTSASYAQVNESDGAVLRYKEVIADEKPSADKDKTYDVVEQMPEFPGGQAALLKWISNNVKYPTIAEENGIQGRVICTFVVERDGSIVDVQVARPIDTSLDNEAVRVLSQMPRWNPGKLHGQPVRVKYTVPVTFKLVDNAKTTSSNAEEAYRKALKDYFVTRRFVFEDIDLKNMASGVNKQLLLDYDSSQQDVLLKRYHDTQFSDDYLNCFLLPSFKGVMSLEELQGITALYKTPEGQEYIEHEAAFNKKIEDFIKHSIAKDITALKRGDRLKDVKQDKGIPKKYVMKFYESTDTSLISSLITPLYNMLMKEDGLDDKSLLVAVLEHQRRNLSIIMLNCSYGAMTEDDVEFEKRLNNTVSQKQAITAISNIMANNTQYSKNWVSAYTDWLLRQPEVCDFLLQKIIDEANVEALANEADTGQTVSFTLEPQTFVMVLDLYKEDDLTLEETKEELRQKGEKGLLDELKETILSGKELLLMIANSNRSYTIRFKDNQSGEAVDLVMDNQEVRKLSADFDALTAGIQGKELFDEEQYEKAFPLLKQAAEVGDVSSQYFVAASYYTGQGVDSDGRAALFWYAKVVSQDGNKVFKAKALNDLAYIFLDMEKYDDALKMVDQAIETMPEEPNYYDSKGEILYRTGDKKGAKDMWQKVVSLDPDFANTHNSDLYRLLYGKKNNK